MITLLGGAVFRIFGVGLGPARVLAGLAMLALSIWTAITLRPRFGDSAALLGAALAIFHGANFALARTPSVIPVATLTIALLLSLAARRRRAAPWIALVLVPMAAVLIHRSIALAALPILIEALSRVGGVRAAVSRIPFPAAALATAAAAAAWISLPFEPRAKLLVLITGVAPQGGEGILLAVPLLLPLAWCGFLLFLVHAEARRGPGRSLERLVHGVVWMSVALHTAGGGASTSELAEVIPFIAWLAVAAWSRAGNAARRRSLPLDGARGAFASFVGVLGTIGIALEARTILVEGGSSHGLGLPLAGLTIVLAFGLPVARRPGRATLAVAAWLLLLVPGLWESALILGHPGRSICRTGSILERQLLPTACLGGPWGRVLTLGNDLAWSVAEDDPRLTHQPHVTEATEGVLDVSSVSTIGTSITISRLDPERGGWSAFESGRLEERGSRGREARYFYFMVLHGEPGHPTAWERIAETLLTEGDRTNGYRCLLHSLLGDPDSVETRRRLAEIYLEHECPDEAMFHLMHARRAGAATELLAPLWTRLPSDLRE